jgi:hypothetical protein
MEIVIWILIFFAALGFLIYKFPWVGNVIMYVFWLFGMAERYTPDGKGGYWKL